MIVMLASSVFRADGGYQTYEAHSARYWHFTTWLVIAIAVWSAVAFLVVRWVKERRPPGA
jgi:hypothetical protein